MIPLWSILHHTRTHTRPLDASRKHTPVARPSTAEAHTINQQKGQGHQKARGRDKRFSHLEFGGMAYFALSSSTRPARNIHNLLLVWRRRPVTAGRPCPWVLVTLDVYFPSQSFFPTNNNNKNNHSSCQPPPPPTLPRPPVLGLCQQQQQGASMGRTVSDSCWSATDPAGPALLGSSTK